jgi:hypothetical protein
MRSLSTIGAAYKQVHSALELVQGLLGIGRRPWCWLGHGCGIERMQGVAGWKFGRAKVGGSQQLGMAGRRIGSRKGSLGEVGKLRRLTGTGVPKKSSQRRRV